MFGRLRSFYSPADANQPKRLININALIEQAAASDQTALAWSGAQPGGDDPPRTGPCASETPLLLADAAELRELLTNLIFNAVDAMPEGGTLRLHTRLEPSPGSETITESDGILVLEVADTGTGMSEETRRRCLEPFFTTKGDEGTGLGLAMVYGTVQRHGGVIDLRSTLGEGTTFILHLPLRPPGEPGASGGIGRSGQPTIARVGGG